MTPNDPSLIYKELTERYNKISVATVKDLLKGKIKAAHNNVDFVVSSYSTPNIEEAESAFLKYTCAIFTAFRGGYTLDENLHRNELLKADMKACGLHYRPVTGCYREADWEFANIEYCYFVYNDRSQREIDFFSKVYSLSEKYSQDSFLYKRAGINRTAFLVATNDAGRKEFRGDIRFAGCLFLHVPDVDAWTDCSNGRFAFQLKGMILIGTDCPKMKLGEGNLFDIDGYNPSAIIAVAKSDQSEILENCKRYSGKVPLYQHTFVKENQTEDSIHRALISALNKAKSEKCRRIGLYCSATIDNSYNLGASAVLTTVKEWLARYHKKVDWLVLVDTYGDYAKAISEKSSL